MSDAATLGSPAAVFTQLWLLAFGGTNSVLPEMQHQVVELHPWLTASEFAALFALAQPAPGPNMLVVTLIGWRVAALPGALVTTLGVAGPSSVLTFIGSGLWYRFRDARWRRQVQAGLMPVTAGLVMASAAMLIRTTSTESGTASITIAATVLFLFSRLHPLLVLGAAAAMGATGLLD
ncbi:MAG TPA: chromate transporter [Acetobacteraceae bacterium]|nr:chromate transporter [Acetobacteraceae bacterium]